MTRTQRTNAVQNFLQQATSNPHIKRVSSTDSDQQLFHGKCTLWTVNNNTGRIFVSGLNGRNKVDITDIYAP